MLETITALTALQQIDDQVRDFKTQRTELKSNLDGLHTILGRMASELEDKREKVAESKRFYGDKQTDLKMDSERLAKAKSKLTTVTRTKEYAAMQRELDNLRKKYSEDETELKRLAEAIAEYNASIKMEGAKLSDLQAEVEREEASSADRLTELEGIIGKTEVDKDAIRAKLPPGTSSRYERILARREGKAVVPARDGKCTGCQIRLPPQMYIVVLRGERLVSCPSCQRFLYPPQAESSATEDADTAE